MSVSAPDRAFAREIAGQGLRVTRQRIALLRILRGAVHHPTVIELHEALRREQRRVSRKTVYQILDSFVRAGLASCPTEGGQPFRYEPMRDPHDHAHCRRCGDLYDLPSLARPALRRPRALPAGFRVENVSVLVRGVCKRCRRRRAR
jgi:Fur family transcriptional regulator, peroxide stress response regulator